MNQFTDETDKPGVQPPINNAGVAAALRQQSVSIMLDDILAPCGPHQRAVLGMFALSQRFNFDLSKLLADLNPELPRGYQAIVTGFSNAIEEGETVDDSLQKHPSLLPARTVLALQLAGENNTLEPLYAGILNRRHDANLAINSEKNGALSGLLHACGVGLLATAVIIFLMIKIVPQMLDMLEEFGIRQPAAFELFTLVPVYWVPVIFIVAIAMSPILIPALIKFLYSWSLSLIHI